jgi:hypothetical protein
MYSEFGIFELCPENVVKRYCAGIGGPWTLGVSIGLTDIETSQQTWPNAATIASVPLLKLFICNSGSAVSDLKVSVEAHLTRLERPFQE